MASDNSEQFPELNDDKKAFEWVKKKELLIQNGKCVSCGNPLQVTSVEDDLTFEALKCNNSGCQNKKPLSIYEGSFFDSISESLNISHYLHLIKYWCNKEVQTQVVKTTNITEHIVKKVYRKCREFCANYFKGNSIQLLEPKTVVLKKYTLNRKERKPLWLLMMVAKEPELPNRIGYMELLNPENPDYLELNNIISILRKVVDSVGEVCVATDDFEPPTTESRKFKFAKCTKEENEIISSYYRDHNDIISNITRKGPVSPEIYLQECMWRDRVKGDVFDSFINDLKSYYNPVKKISDSNVK